MAAILSRGRWVNQCGSFNSRGGTVVRLACLLNFAQCRWKIISLKHCTKYTILSLILTSLSFCCTSYISCYIGSHYIKILFKSAITFASHVKTVSAKPQIFGTSIYGSSEMYWMTFPWPWPKVTAVAKSENHSPDHYKTWQLYCPSHGYYLIRFWRNYIGNCYFGKFSLKISDVFFQGQATNLVYHWSIHIHFRLKCFPCPILWGWQHWYMYIFIYKFIENKRLSNWQHCHHWWHCKLSFWQLTVPPVMTMLSIWRLFVFSDL